VPLEVPSDAPWPPRAGDPRLARWNQQSVTAGELAREYGLTDVDGAQPMHRPHGLTSMAVSAR
jgi:hypothetical protein